MKIFSVLDCPFWFPETLSTTRDIELFSSCEYKWFLARILHFNKHVSNIDLEAGGEFAKAHELTRTAYFKENKPMQEAIDIGTNHLLIEYAKIYEKEKFQDDLKTPERMADIFRTMYDQVQLKELSVIPFEMEDKSLSVEQEFSVNLPYNHPETGKPLVLKCLIDLLGMKDNIVYVVDEKTCKSVLEDRVKQLDLLKTQNQFVQYVTVANKNKEKFGNLEVTHVRINKCKIKKTYAKNEAIIEPYDFEVDIWFQKTWWDTLLFKINRMLEQYNNFLFVRDEFTDRKIIFPRAYGLACTAFYRPCQFTTHCTSGMGQDLPQLGFKQSICNSKTKGQEVTVRQYREYLLENKPLPEKRETIVETELQTKSMEDFLQSFL